MEQRERAGFVIRENRNGRHEGQRALCLGLLLGLLGAVPERGLASVESGALYVPLTSAAPVSPQALWTNNPAVLSLDGQWSFLPTKGCFVGDRFINADERASMVTVSTQEHQPGFWFYAGKRGWKCERFRKCPQYWQIDLGSPQEVRELDLVFMDPTFVQTIAIEGSDNGREWRPLAEFTDAKDGTFTLPPSRVTLLRVVFRSVKNAHGADDRSGLNRAVVKVERDGRVVPWAPVFKPVDDAFAGTTFDDSRWNTMPVPGNWEVEGFSKPSYNLPDNAAGLYRRWVEVPASFAGKRLLWHFDGISFGADIWVNGKKAAHRDGCFTATWVDVTGLVKPGGKNLFALRVCKQTDESKFDAGDFWSLGGIQRSTSLVALPVTSIEDIRLTTRVDSVRSNATLEAAVTVRGKPGEVVAVTGRLHDAAGQALARPVLEVSCVLDSSGRADVLLHGEVASPRLWSAEKPDLYTLVVGVVGKTQAPRSSGEACPTTDCPPLREYVQERFGFRQVALKDGILLLNGRPIKLFGVCRHEERGDVGHALTLAHHRKDIEMMKAANINAVRTSHYPPSRQFLELCDELGLYVLDEVPACWTPVTDPLLAPYWLKRTELAWGRDKNFTCVIAWNIGNESGFGPSNLAAYKRMLELDSSRPALVSCAVASKDPSLTLSDFHYIDLKALESSTIDRGRPRAVIITEGPHTFCNRGALQYDWGIKDFFGEALRNQTEVIWRLPSALGGFIWEWQDQGLADKFPQKDTSDPVTAALAGTEADLGGSKDLVKVEAPATLSSLRGNNFKGIVDPFRKPNPEHFNVCRAYCPVMIKQRGVMPGDNQWVVEVENRYAFTDLSELKASWQALAGKRLLAEGSLAARVSPGAKGILRIPIHPQADALRLKFVHPDGRVVLSTCLDIPGRIANPPPKGLPADPVAVLEKTESGNLMVRAAGCELVVDGKTGGIVSWKRGADQLADGGPFFTLGEKRIYRGEASKLSYQNKPVPAVQSKSACVFAARSVEAQALDKQVQIRVAGRLSLVESPKPVADLDYTLCVQPNGSIGVNWKLVWTGEVADAWELGMRLSVPLAGFETLRWVRRGLWSDYPEGHIAAEEGTASSKDIRFRSAKRDVVWATLGGRSLTAITAIATDSALHVRGLDVSGKRYLCLCSEVAPPRDYSGNLQDDRVIRLIPGKAFSGAFLLQPTAPGE